MIKPRDWIPVRWDGGEIELARRKAAGMLPPDAAQQEGIRNWYRAASLDLLQDTPVNCLLLRWSGGLPHDTESPHRAGAAAHAKTARERGFTTLAAIAHGPDWQRAVESALASGFAGLVVEGDFSGEGIAAVLARAKGRDMAVIPLRAWPLLTRDNRFPAVIASGSAWPRLRPFSDDGAVAGPTGSPWIESNHWRVQVLRETIGDAAVWLDHRPPPDDPEASGAFRYQRAVADAAMGGGCWIVDFDDAWRAGLAAGESGAISQWREVVRTLGFFHDHRAELGQPPAASLTVVLDPATVDPFLTGEMLNLLARRQIPFHVVTRDAFEAAGPGAALAVVFLDPPRPAEKDQLRQFAAAGGVALVGPGWTQEETEVARGREHGRIVPFPDGIGNPDEFVRELERQLGFERLGVRAFNTWSVISYLSQAREGGRLLQITEYGSYPTDRVTVRMARSVNVARWWSLRDEPRELAVAAFGKGSEFGVPGVPVYSAVHLQ